MSINPVSFNSVNDLPLAAQQQIESQSNSMALQQIQTAHEHRQEENDEIQQQADS